GSRLPPSAFRFPLFHPAPHRDRRCDKPLCYTVQMIIPPHLLVRLEAARLAALAAESPAAVDCLPAVAEPPAPPRRRWKRRARQMGRPTLLTEEIADAMYESILKGGFSDSR